MNDFLICDVCEEVLEGPICDNCQFDNTYQYDPSPLYYSILAYIKNIEFLSEEVIETLICEQFGLTTQEAKYFIKEIDLDGFEINDNSK